MMINLVSGQHYHLHLNHVELIMEQCGLKETKKREYMLGGRYKIFLKLASITFSVYYYLL